MVPAPDPLYFHPRYSLRPPYQRSLLSRYIDVRKLASGTVEIMHSYSPARHESYLPSRVSPEIRTVGLRRFGSEYTSDTRPMMIRQFSRGGSTTNGRRNLTKRPVLQTNSSELRGRLLLHLPSVVIRADVILIARKVCSFLRSSLAWRNKSTRRPRERPRVKDRKPRDRDRK